MSAPLPSRLPGAVFLSYAHEDAGAARRVTDALRDAGVEVWFDQNELRGGDAWDAKIRRQIRDCALFVPIISAHTQARPEGYFRLEWKLAVDRSHLMSDDHPFLFPVVIDDTPEAGARVPDKFREVQWTRLDLRETPASLAARIAGLLARADGEGARPEPRTPRPKHVAWWTRVGILVGAIFALAYGLRPLWRQLRPVPSRPAASTSSATTAPTKTQQLVAQARALYEPWDGATRADFALAEQLLTRATELDSTDGEAWAAYGVLLCGQIVLAYDRSPSRSDLARDATERAVKLAPKSRQARLARAYYFRFNDATQPEAERMLRELVNEDPTDKLALRTLAAKLRQDDKLEESLAYLERAAALPGGDPVARYNQFLALWRARRYAEAEAAIDRALGTHPVPYLYWAKIKCQMLLHGDLDAAAGLLGKIPPAYQLEDSGVYWSCMVALWRREPEKCLAAARGVSRDVIENDFGGPRAYLAGLAHHLAGRPEAAAAEWRAALLVAERELRTQPNAARWIFWKARLLARLGRAAEAEAELKTCDQLLGATTIGMTTAPIHALLGRKQEVIDVLENQLRNDTYGGRALLTSMLRHDPDWDVLRAEPGFQSLLESSRSEAK